MKLEKVQLTLLFLSVLLIAYASYSESIVGKIVLEPSITISSFLEYPELKPGEDQIVSVKIIKNFGTILDDRSEDVMLRYYLLDESKSVVLFETSQSVAIQTSASFVKRISLSEELAEGKYFIRTRVETQDGEARNSSSSFEVIGENSLKGLGFLPVIIISLLILIIILLFCVIRRLGKVKNSKKK